jgi:hypothetical protein
MFILNLRTGVWYVLLLAVTNLTSSLYTVTMKQ